MASGLLNRLISGFLPKSKTMALLWQPAKVLDQGNAGGAQLVMDKRGRGLVVWENSGNLWGLRFGVSGSEVMTSYPLGPGSSPHLAMNDKGQGVLVWQSAEAGQLCLHASIFNMDKFDVQGRTIACLPGRIHKLWAAVDRRGGVMVSWVSESAEGWQVQIQSFSPRSNTWDESPAPLGEVENSPLDPAFAMSTKGQAMVLLSSQSGKYEGLEVYHHWPSERLWSDRPVPVASRSGQDLQLVMDKAGNALALWVCRKRDRRDALESAYFRASSSEWDEPRSLAMGASIAKAELVFSADGDALAVWHQQEQGGGSRIFSRHGRDGEWVDNPDRLDHEGTSARHCALAMGSSGELGVLMVHSSHVGEIIQFRTWGGSWSAPVQIAQPLIGHPSDLKLALGASSAAAVWREGEREGARLYFCKGH